MALTDKESLEKVITDHADPALAQKAIRRINNVIDKNTEYKTALGQAKVLLEQVVTMLDVDADDVAKLRFLSFNSFDIQQFAVLRNDAQQAVGQLDAMGV